MKIYYAFLLMTLPGLIGCEITTGFIYEEKISPTQSMKATIELKKIEVRQKGRP